MFQLSHQCLSLNGWPRVRWQMYEQVHINALHDLSHRPLMDGNSENKYISRD